MNLNLDFGFFNWGLVQSFILKGLIFSFQLTIVAMIGGIALGTILVIVYFHLVNGRGSSGSGRVTAVLSQPVDDPDTPAPGHRADPAQE